MSKIEEFKRLIHEGYHSKGDRIILNGALLDGEFLGDAHVKITLKTSLSDTK